MRFLYLSKVVFCSLAASSSELSFGLIQWLTELPLLRIWKGKWIVGIFCKVIEWYLPMYHGLMGMLLTIVTSVAVDVLYVYIQSVIYAK